MNDSTNKTYMGLISQNPLINERIIFDKDLTITAFYLFIFQKVHTLNSVLNKIYKFQNFERREVYAPLY